MTRVPTTASYKMYMQNISGQKNSVNQLSYQATTGNKYSSYDQYGLSSYRILSLQNEEARITKYLETNNISKVALESQQKAIDDIRKSMIDFRDQLRNFYSNDLKAMSENPTEEELIALRNVQEAAFEAMSLMAYYLNSQVDGNYVFGGGSTAGKPVDFPYTTLEEFQAVYDGLLLTYPGSNSSSLSQMGTSSSVSGGTILKQDFQTLLPKYFPIEANGANNFTFDSATQTVSAAADTFSALKAGDTITIAGSGGNDQTFTITGVAEDGSSITVAEPVADEVSDAAAINKASWTFTQTTDPETGDVTNSMTGRVGEFSNLKVGEQIKISGTGANNGFKTIKSISEDGKTVVFEEDVVPEAVTINQPDAQIEQSLKTGTITAQTNVGQTIKEFKVDAANPITVDTTNNTISALRFNTFGEVKAGQTITITDAGGVQHELYVKGVSADGKTLDISTSTPVPTTMVPGEMTVRTHSDIHGFVTDTMKGSPLQTGDISFDVRTNSMSATVKGAYSSYKPGDTLVIKGADANDKTYIVKSVSADGRTVNFEESTPVEENMNINSGNQIAGGTGITIGKSYPVGATIDMSGTNGAYNGKYTVIGVSPDGKTLHVKTDDFPEYGAEITFNSADLKTDSYYNGGHLETTYRLSETSSVTNNVTAASSAFEKLFRAMGSVAQGNMLDPDDFESAGKRVSEALDLLDGALNANSKEPNGDITSIQYSVISKLDLVKTTIDSQTSTQESVKTYLSNMTKVDKTEAVTYLLQAKQDLEVSYSVLAQINQMSLLNYIK